MLTRDIKPGANLPDLDLHLKGRVDKATPTGDRGSLPDTEFLNAAREQALTPVPALTREGREAARDEELNAAKRVLQNHFFARSYHEFVNAVDQEAMNVDGDTAVGRPAQVASVPKLVRNFTDMVEKLAIANAKNQVAGDRLAELKQRTIAKPIDPQTKKQFTTALKQMDFIQLILSDRRRDPGATDKVKSAEWKDGGKLEDGRTIETANQPLKSQIRHDIDSGKLLARIQEADRFIRLLVEPEQLATIKRPTIAMHTKWAEKSIFSPTSWTDSNVYRANQSGNTVNIAQNEETWTIVHEVGHYLERELPIETWSDIRTLIQERHAQAKPQDPTKAVGGRGTSSEGGFAGEYAATGKYTSRAYSTGDTEMLSLTIEYLKNPDKTLKMLENDPVQAAVILRNLRPKDYAANVGAAFDEFIPNPAVPVTA